MGHSLSAAVFKTKFVLLTVLPLLVAGCAPTDEVAEKTSGVGFEMAAASETNITPAVTAVQTTENPINAALPQSIVPIALSIPSIGIKAPVQHLGMNDKGEMAVPDEIDEVSWFEPGYRPGQKGRAVIAGHVDGVEGPAIFWDLSDVQAGDQIHVSSDKEQLTFEIYKMESIPLALANVAEVFGPATNPELVLITCSGTYNRDWGTREERLVVYAKLVSSS